MEQIVVAPVPLITVEPKKNIVQQIVAAPVPQIVGHFVLVCPFSGGFC